MYTLRCFAGLIVWLSAIGIILVFALAGIIFLANAGVITSNSTANSWMNIPTLSSGTTSEYKAFGYTSFGIAGFLFILLLCCCGRIRIAVAVCKAAGQFVAHTCSVVFVPIIQTGINIAMWAVCIVALLFLVSTTSYSVTTGDIFTSITSYTSSSLI